jgi:exodeoxyribonuclease VII large subunit
MSPYLSVSELTGMIKDRLERSFPDVSVTGEVSNFRPASSGHWYFTIKDADAALQCVLFRGRRRDGDGPPADGDLVDVVGSVSVYPPRGSYQLIVRHMRPSGRGAILQMLEERRERLAREGLFDRSRPLPLYPSTVVVVTSPTGAVLRDILHVLRRRREKIQLRIIPVPVQGNEASGRIASAIRYAGRHALGETLIVGRGGGSIEDLLPFSDEDVVRAVAECPIPVVSAVGHETDWSLCDYAADVRAPTPSAAAEVVSARDSDVIESISNLRQNIFSAFRRQVDERRSRLDHSGEEELRYRFRNFVQPWYQRLDEAHRTLVDGIGRIVDTRRHRLTLLSERMEAADPYGPLERGFALVRRAADRVIVTSRKSVRSGDPLVVQFHDGSVQVEKTGDE